MPFDCNSYYAPSPPADSDVYLEQFHLHCQTLSLHVHIKCLREHFLLALIIFKFQIPFFWKTNFKLPRMGAYRGINSIRHVA